MLLAVLGQRFLEAGRDFQAGDAGAEARIWMLALRNSDVTDIRRQAARRKPARRAARGRVTHDPTQSWRIAGAFDETMARVDLGDLDRRGTERLAKLVMAWLPFLPDATTPA